MQFQVSGEESIRVLVADDTRIHTQLLADALRRDHYLEVISSPSHSRDLIEAVNLHQVDVAVISSNLDEEPLRGFEVIRELRSSRPELRTIMLLDSSKREPILEAFRAGARGIFSRHESVETLPKCVRKVHEGQIWANGRQMTLALEALASSPTVRAVDANGLNLLSKRELDVVRSLAEGLTNREIAERLGLSQHTIKNYLFRVFDKLGVSSRIELLFLTLSQPIAQQAAAEKPTNGKHKNATTVGGCQKAAEQGLITAQIEMAQACWKGKGDASDTVSAYMWYLVAHDQILRARKSLAKTMTVEQLLEAEQRAAEWLKRTAKRNPTPEISDAPARPTIVARSRVSSA
jgi:two-component system nitrate/nitrite response regulator NarL